MKLHVPCEEANHFCDKNQYKEAGFLEKVKLNIHLIYCRACRTYSKKNNKLTRIVKHQSIQHITPPEKAILRQRVEKHINSPSL